MHNPRRVRRADDSERVRIEAPKVRFPSFWRAVSFCAPGLAGLSFFTIAIFSNRLLILLYSGVART